MNSTAQISAVDMFCGIGGLSYGLMKEGIQVLAGIDIDFSCKYAFEKNVVAEFIARDVGDISAKNLRDIFPDVGWRVLAGCAPCAPFSKYSRNPGDGRWKLLKDFGRLVEGTLPHVVTMENVPQLQAHRVFETFLDILEDNSYCVEWQVVDCRHYGVPQKRRRLVLLASRLGGIRLVPRTHYPATFRTVRQTINGLEAIGAGEASRRDPIHRARGLSELNLKRIRHTPRGGGWRSWSEDLRLECHKRDSGKTFRDVYGRMRWDEPSPTLTTHCTGWGNGRFGHPDQDRAISVREAALIQTFPKSYAFVPKNSSVPVKQLSRHIGNAVPVRLGRIIGRSIVRHLGEFDG